jgi:hypothetical protein
LKLSYKGKNFADTKSKVPFAVLPNNSFNLKTDGVINVNMSSDFKEVLIVSDKEIDMKLLQELVSYEKDYKVISY